MKLHPGQHVHMFVQKSLFETYTASAMKFSYFAMFHFFFRHVKNFFIRETQNSSEILLQEQQFTELCFLLRSIVFLQLASRFYSHTV